MIDAKVMSATEFAALPLATLETRREFCKRYGDRCRFLSYEGTDTEQWFLAINTNYMSREPRVECWPILVFQDKQLPYMVGPKPLDP